jgi:hypothetical protein
MVQHSREARSSCPRRPPRRKEEEGDRFRHNREGDTQGKAAFIERALGDVADASSF